MLNLRTKVFTKPRVLVFHLREVVCCSVLNKWTKEIWLFGNTRDRHSVAVKIVDFLPYFYVDKIDMNPTELKSMLNSELRGCVLDIQPAALVPVIGFYDNKPRDLYKITYKNATNLNQIRNFLNNHMFKVVDVPMKIRLYHDDWTIENLFLHSSRLKLQEWTEVIGSYHYGTDVVSTCQLELEAKICTLSKSKEQYEECPLLLCCVRLDNLTDDEGQIKDIRAIHTRYYWMGENETEGVSYQKRNTDENIQDFYKQVYKSDIDCYVFLSDNCNPLIEIAKRSCLKLSKFRYVRQNPSATGSLIELPHYTAVLHPGRSRMDIKSALSKMFIEPKLESFTLESAIRHPRLLKNVVLGECSSITDQTDQLALLDKDNSLLLGFIQLSSACFTNITKIVEGGQQVRVWSKLINKFHERGLLVNKERFRSTVMVVKKTLSESSYPDLPDLPNVPIIERRKSTNTDLFGTKIEKVIKKRESKGGYVFQPVKGFYKIPTLIFDFMSLYPSIMRSDSVCSMRLLYSDQSSVLDDPDIKTEYVPITDSECIVLVSKARGEKVPTVLPEITEEVCRERIWLKNQMKKLQADSFEYKSLDAKQLACKVFQNSLYGALGATVYDDTKPRTGFIIPVLLAMVCKIGQYMIKRVKHFFLSKYKAFIVYGDTDSVMIQIPLDYKNLSVEQIQSETDKMGLQMEQAAMGLFKAPHKLELEKVYDTSLFFEVKKMYAGLIRGGSIEIKGLGFKKRDKCPWVRRVGNAIVRSLLYQKTDCILTYLDSEFTSLVEGKIPLSDLCISCLIKPLREYKSDTLVQTKTAEKILHRTGKQVEPGSRLSFVIVQGKGKQYERGEPLDYVEHKNIPIDYHYYLSNQMLRAISILFTHHPDLQKKTVQMVDNYKQKIEFRKNKVQPITFFVNRKRKADMVLNS